MISLIWAQDLNKGIGIDNLLPWSIKEEMQHFCDITKNQIVVMGQKTFESIGKPLINRLNIVISDDPKFQYENVIVYNDIQKLMDDYKNKHIYIIGGKIIYEIFASIADELIVSKIKKTYNCNRHINIDFGNFKLVKKEEHPDFTAEWWHRQK